MVYTQLQSQNEGKVPCFVCKKHVTRREATLEHVIPKSLGGEDDFHNFAISHSQCNHDREFNASARTWIKTWVSLGDKKGEL